MLARGDWSPSSIIIWFPLPLGDTLSFDSGGGLTAFLKLLLLRLGVVKFVLFTFTSDIRKSQVSDFRA